MLTVSSYDDVRAESVKITSGTATSIDCHMSVALHVEIISKTMKGTILTLRGHR